MTNGCYHFGPFTLDPVDRQLRRDGEPVDLNARYLDALALLLSEQGRLVTKDRFLGEVWQGVPVTDEALTQCIRTLRRQLGDSAARPRFIETVPKHGYRFIAQSEWVDDVSDGRTDASPDAFTNVSTTVAATPAPGDRFAPRWRNILVIGGVGTAGGGVAGIVGGLLYGFAAASQPMQSGVGAISVLLILLCITLLVALLGAAGVSFGIAAGLASDRPRLWSIVGGACGGLIVGAFVKLLGVDAFHLLFGGSPGDITGAVEGAMLGGAVGFAVWLGNRGPGADRLRRSMAVAGLTGGVAGVAISLLGGRLLGGSLDLLARSFPGSRLSLDQIGVLFGETGLGPVSRAITSGAEGALFGACIAAAIVIARRSRARAGNDGSMRFDE